MPETILLDVADGVATLTLNQPAKRNPMTVRMGEEIAEALRGLTDPQRAERRTTQPPAGICRAAAAATVSKSRACGPSEPGGAVRGGRPRPAPRRAEFANCPG
jgi:hypothetical protein